MGDQGANQTGEHWLVCRLVLWLFGSEVTLVASATSKTYTARKHSWKCLAVAKCLDGWCDFHLGNGCSFQGAIGQPLSQVFFWCPVCLKKNRKHPKFFFSFFVIVERSPPSVRISFLFLFKDQPPFFRVVLSLSSLPPFLLGYFHS